MSGSWCGGFSCVSTSQSDATVYTVEGAACIGSIARVRAIVAEVLKYKLVSASPLKRHSGGTLTVETSGGFWDVDPETFSVSFFEVSRTRQNVRYVLKFYGDRKLSSIAWEYAVGVFLGDKGIGPIVHWISPPLQSPKLGLFGRKEIPGIYIMSEKVGWSADVILRQFSESRNYDEKRYLHTIFTISKRWIEKIAQLHSLGILHGNVTGENFVLKLKFDSRGDKNEYLLTNFAQARFVCDDSIHTSYGYRDDIFGVFKTISEWISKRELSPKVDIHTEFDLFGNIEEYNPFKWYVMMTPVLKDYIRQCLSRAMDYIHSIDSGTEPLTFEILLDAIECARGAVEASTRQQVDS